MTDLQMGLIGLGGVAVMGVLAYNKWQERKHRKMAEELLGARQAVRTPCCRPGWTHSRPGA